MGQSGRPVSSAPGCRSGLSFPWNGRIGRQGEAAAEGDQWANPAGQFQVLQAADPGYRFLGTEGLAAKEMPPQGQLVDSPLGFYVREGKHSMTTNDWAVFMNFADRQWHK